MSAELYVRPATLFCAFRASQLLVKGVPPLRPCVSAGAASAAATARPTRGAVTVRSTTRRQPCHTSHSMIALAAGGKLEAPIWVSRSRIRVCRIGWRNDFTLYHKLAGGVVCQTILQNLMLFYLSEAIAALDECPLSNRPLKQFSPVRRANLCNFRERVAVR